TQRIHTAVSVSSDHVDATGYRLEEHDSEALPRARHHHDIRQTVIIGQFLVGNRACKPHLVLNSKFRGQRREAWTIIAIADNEVDRFGMLQQNLRQTPDNPIVPLVALRARQPGHGHEDLFSARIMAIEQVTTFWPRMESWTYGIRKHFHPSGLHSDPFEQAPSRVAAHRSD